MRGCLTFILIIIIIALVISFPVTIIGIGILLWGIYEYNINKQLKAKSKLIPVIISFGLILSIFGCSIGLSNEDNKDVKDGKTAVKNTADKNINEQNDSETSESNDNSKENNKVAVVKQTQVKSSNSKKLIPVKLIETVDGDTIKVKYKGKEETVRYLLIDTPESKKPGACVQPYAKSAFNKNKQLVNSGQLSIEFEKNSKKDKYGRLLAYVYVNGKSVQESLLKGGYARVAYIYDPPYKYLKKYQKAEQSAQNNALNIWSKSGYVTDNGFKGCVSSPSKKSTSNTNKNSSTSNPNSSSTTNNSTPSNSESTGIEYFSNCTELRTKYPNGVRYDHPAYQSKLDRDKDNYACER